MWLTRGYYWWQRDFQARFPANWWSILVDLRSRILKVVVLTTVDGLRGRIDDLKLRWPVTFAAFFRPDEAEETMKTTGVLLCRRLETFLWWCGGWRRPEVGDRRRETVWGCTMVWTLAWYTGAAEVCEPLDLWWNDRATVIGYICRWIDGRMSIGFDLVWRGTPKSRYTGWRGATTSNLGLFQRLRCVGICLVFFKLFLRKKKQYPALSWRKTRKKY